MKLNWESITHFFQIPIEWFRRVDRLIHIIGDNRYLTVDQKGEDGTVLKFNPEGLGGGADLSGVGAYKLVGTDANSAPAAAASLLTTAPTVDKVLTTKKNDTTLTWEDADRPAESPSSPTSLVPSSYTSSTANTTTWTAGGTKGVTEREVSRVVWTGTYLYGFYRTKTYDRFGRLYSISGETRFTIDTPVTYNP